MMLFSCGSNSETARNSYLQNQPGRDTAVDKEMNSETAHVDEDYSDTEIVSYQTDDKNNEYIEKPEEAVYNLNSLEYADFNVYDGNKYSIYTITNLIDYYAIYSGMDDSDTYLFYFDEEIDDSKKEVISTQRGIYLGDSKDKVVKYYGKGESGTVNEKDFLFKLLQDDESGRSSDLADLQCKSFIRYEEVTMGRISFYFDDHDEVSWVVYEIYHD